MTDEPQDADSPSSEPGQPAEPPRSIWATPPTLPTPPPPPPPAPAPPADDAGEPAAEDEAPTEAAEPSGAEPAAEDEGAESDSVSTTTDAEPVAMDDWAVPVDVSEPAEAEAEAEDDEAKRAELEAEIDRQLSALVPTDEAEEADEGEYDAGPPTAADEADTLVDRLAPDLPPPLPTWTTPSSAGYVEPETEPLPSTPADPAAAELEGIASGAVLAEKSSRGPIVPILIIGLLIAAVVGVIFVVGGDDDDPTAEATTTTASAETTQPQPGPGGDLEMPAAEALGYFQIYGTQLPEHLTRMLALAVPDSPAWAYAKHQETLARIDPERNEPLIVELGRAEVVACPQDQATGGCVVYTDFRKDANGLMIEFSINGTPVRDRIALGSATEVTAGGMRIKVISRYVSVSDRIFVAYEVHNAGGTPIVPVSVRYITPAGETIEPDNDTFRQPVQPGTTIHAAGAFPTTEAGGSLQVVSTEDGGASQQVAQIQTP